MSHKKYRRKKLENANKLKRGQYLPYWSSNTKTGLFFLLLLKNQRKPEIYLCIYIY